MARTKPRYNRSQMTEELAERCRELVFSTAQKYGLPPVFITAHVRTNLADFARVEVWTTMIREWGMSRQLVANIFGRDRRRLRASVLDGHRRSRRRRVGFDYSQVDLFGQPLSDAQVLARASRKAGSYRERFEEAVAVLKLAAAESAAARKWLRSVS